MTLWLTGLKIREIKVLLTKITMGITFGGIVEI
jgi:hypothetical protein